MIRFFFSSVVKLIAALGGTSVLAETTYPISPGLSIAPYGQFHFAYQGFDDGEVLTGNIVDITNANSRAGFYPRDPEGLDGLSFHFETGLEFRPSRKTSQTNTPDFLNW